MMRFRLFLLMFVLCIAFLFAGSSLAESGTVEPAPTLYKANGAGDDLAEWTVMFYLCGSDLESKYGYASGNLEEIAGTCYPDNFMEEKLKREGVIPDGGTQNPEGRVEVLVETGGSREWHAEDLGMDVDPNALQRWSYNAYSMFDAGVGEFDEEFGDGRVYGFELLQTLPLQSMADPETLSGFIRWGIETKPAKKYALVLWGHGDGARSGLLIDELFDEDVMYLYELREALVNGGVHFEAVIIDACLMANIETAWNLKDHADWLVASEEAVPGKGTAIGEWLQQMRTYPECDGEWLGRLVCDTTSFRYANEESDEARSILTWSVIDLSKVDALIDAAGRLFKDMGDALRDDPTWANLYMRYLAQTARYGDGEQRMRDFGSLVYSRDLAQFIRRSTRNAAIQALSDAVAYCVRGSGRSEARGLTFCYPAGFSNGELDIYAKNFPMPRYLAYLDAVSDWTAPDWVYESVERLPEIDDIDELQIKLKKQRCRDGMPGLLFEPGVSEMNVQMTYYTLYQVNGETGETVRLGRTDCIMDPLNNENFDLIWRAADPMHWPAIEGRLVCMDLVQSDSYMKLYNVPVMLGSQPGLLRLGRRVTYAGEEQDRINEYEVYGVWEGYEENSVLLNRSVRPLSGIVGREYQLLYPVDGADSSRTSYESSEPLTMYRALDVEEIPLPAGTYYLEYEVEDVFMRKTPMGRIEILWDGEHMTFPAGDAWESDDWINLTQLRRGE